MDRNRDIEKKFSEYLDSILAGEEMVLEPEGNEDLRNAVEFAVKMAALRPVPAESYRNNLKARLLQKLDERETAELERRGRFWNALWRQPVWQGAIMVAFAVIVVGLLWRAGIITWEPSQPTVLPTTTSIPTTTIPGTTAPTTTSPTTQPTVSPTQIPGQIFVSIAASTDKSVYQSGEEVKIELILRNDGREAFTIEKVPPILSLMDIDTQQPVFTFTAGTETRTIAPNQTVKFTITWDQLDFDGEPVTGSFYIEVEDLVYLDQPVQLHLDSPVEFDILSRL
jgi:hypothetical protein